MRFIFFVVLFFSFELNAAPSFNCEKASTPAEIMVCSDKRLSFLDNSLSFYYKNLKLVIPSSSKLKLKRSQTKWLKEKDRCLTGYCVAREYKKRINQLIDDLNHYSGSDNVDKVAFEKNNNIGEYTINIQGVEWSSKKFITPNEINLIKKTLKLEGWHITPIWIANHKGEDIIYYVAVKFERSNMDEQPNIIKRTLIEQDGNNYHAISKFDILDVSDYDMTMNKGIYYEMYDLLKTCLYLNDIEINNDDENLTFTYYKNGFLGEFKYKISSKLPPVEVKSKQVTDIHSVQWFRKFFKKILDNIPAYNTDKKDVFLIISPDEKNIFTFLSVFIDNKPSVVLGNYNIGNDKFSNILHTVKQNQDNIFQSDWNIGGLVWKPDSKGIYFDNHGGVACIWYVDLINKSINKIIPDHEAYSPMPIMYHGHNAILFQKGWNDLNDGYWLAVEPDKQDQ